MTEAFIKGVIHPESPPEEGKEEGAYLICNSVGGLVGLQLAVDNPSLVKGVMLLNISLRMLHLKKQPWFAKPFVKALQTTLRETSLGKLFFAQVATPQGVKNALSQAYHDSTRVTDELVEAILKPGLEPGAVDVFLDFISYSGGPLPEELLPQVNVPVYIGWGEEDPWYVRRGREGGRAGRESASEFPHSITRRNGSEKKTITINTPLILISFLPSFPSFLSHHNTTRNREPIALGRAYGEFPCVREFRPFPNLGHCPMGTFLSVLL